MALSKALQFYKELNSRDRQRLHDFVKSPFHNRRPKLMVLLDEFRVTSGDENLWDKREAHGRIFKTEAYNELQINNLLSDLYKLMKKFVAWNHTEQKKSSGELFVLENLIESGSGITKHVIRKNELNNQMHDPHSNYQFNMLADKFYFQQTRKTDNTYILKSLEQLHILYLGNQLKIWCELLNRSNVLALQYEQEELEKFKCTLDIHLQDHISNPYLQLYYPLFQWLQNTGDDTWYEGYSEKLINNIRNIPLHDAKEVCDYIQNYCVKRINQGREEFLRELFKLFSLMIEYNLAHSGQYMNQWTYKNIVTVGVRLKEFEWTEHFIHNYYQSLAPSERDNAYQFNLAVYYYESGTYDRAMQLLNKVHFTDPNYYLDAKSILLKIYFEEESDVALNSLRDTVKIYLLREKLLSKNQKSLYKYLFSFTTKLFRLKYESAHLKRDDMVIAMKKFRDDLNQNALVANKQWLEAQYRILLNELHFSEITLADHPPVGDKENEHISTADND